MTQITLQQALDLAWQHRQAGQLGQSESICRQILAAYPQNTDAMSMLGLVLSLQNKTEEGLAVTHRALAANPNVPLYLCRLGAILLQADRLAEAVQVYRKALTLKPDFTDVHNDLGNALKQLGDIDGAIAAYRNAIASAPQAAIPHNNLGLVLLLKGDFEQGFAEYAWRWRLPNLKIFEQQLQQPRWDGTDLHGRRILLRAEQGFGDAIQFARYVPLIAQRGGRVILACKPELIRLMQSLQGCEKLITHGDPMPDFDLHCTLLDIPGLLKTTLETIPANTPYLHGPSAQKAYWAEKLSRYPKFKVGLVWAGAPLHANDANRSIKLEAFASLPNIKNVTFFSLQKGNAEATMIGDAPLINFTAELNDFADTAALIENLDLVISVDTSVAHLAGALGKPVWTLLPFVPDWRWMLDRDDSPWYPTLKLFRQTCAGDWEGPINRVVQSLKTSIAVTG